MSATELHPTTAALVVAEMQKLGVGRDEIRSAHLERLYGQLKRLSSAPDFSAIPQVLPGGAAREETESRHPLRAVIVETRPHPALDFVLGNVSEILQVPIQLFHGPNVGSPTIRRMVSSGDLTLTPLRVEALNANAYNALLLTRRFWEQVRGHDKILVFQTDSLLCAGSDFGIRDFISFDYIGARWQRKRPVGVVADGGNGGLSLRDKKKTLLALSRFPPGAWPGAEDGYFAFHLDIMGARIGRGDECAKFCTQERFEFRSFGAHQIQRLDPDGLRRFLDYCPDGKKILPV